MNNFICTGFTGTFTQTNALVVNGSLTFGAGMTYNQAGTTLSFRATVSGKQITSNGIQFTAPINFQGVGGQWSPLDDLNSSSTITVTNGAFISNNKNITCAGFSSNNINIRSLILGTSIITITSGLGFDITQITGLSFSTVASTITLLGTNAGFSGGGLNYGTLNINNSGTNIVITGSNTFTTLNSSVVTKTIKFGAGTTQTITNWNVTGAAGNVITITSDSAATHSLVKAGGGVVNVDFVNISFSLASPGSTWNAGLNSVNNGNNSGWIFTAVVPTVTTQAVTQISFNAAVANGTIVSLGPSINDVEGFVFDLASHALPGNVPPSSSGYSGNSSGLSTSTLGSYSLFLIPLTSLTTYFVRAYSHNIIGYGYGGEVSFTTGRFNSGVLLSII